MTVLGLDELRQGVEIPLPVLSGQWTFTLTLRLPGLPPIQVLSLTASLA